MSFPVFVRSYLVLLWKPNVISTPPFLPMASLTLEKKLSVRESQASSPTLAAAARLAAMIHGKDRTYSNNVKVDEVSFLLSMLLCGFKCDQRELQINPFSVSGF